MKRTQNFDKYNWHATPIRRETDQRSPRPVSIAAAIILLMLTAGCVAGPKYTKPSVQVPNGYKEARPQINNMAEGWKPAQPSDAAIRGKWWEMFNDAQLNELEEQVNISNQNIAAATANFMAARAIIRQARAQYYPTASMTPSITNARPSPGQFGGLQAGTSTSGLSVHSFTDYSLPADASWEPDLWGRVRSSVRANTYAAQVSAADLENVRLSAQAQLAINYYELRGQDALKQLLDSTVETYEESLEITQAQYKAGLGSDEAVAQAEAQLKATQAEDTNVGILRAQYEHAIALLMGQPPSTFTLPRQSMTASPPAIPVGIPADALQRRPDIAGAERAVAQANAQIGIAETAFFPNILLSASAGFANSSITDWFTWPSRFWSVGPSLAETIFDAGLRRATMQQYQATYDQTVANYRQDVLTAFQQVEDNLASLRILVQDIEQQGSAIESAQRSFDEAVVRYRAGIDPYLNVISAQTILLTDQQAAIDFRTQQMVSSVQLIEALGGGWNVSQIPSSSELKTKVASVH